MTAGDMARSETPGSGSVRPGTLYVCPTPIGNLRDITLRVLDTLREVDLIVAEDTRHTRKLLAHYEISRPVESYHGHNERAKAVKLVDRLRGGAGVALVSDAGMPGISDPGHRLIVACLEAGLPVEVLPGPSAIVTALVASGLPTDCFVFLGFAPRKSGARERLLEELSRSGETAVFYESPHRIQAFMEALASVMPERPVALARELTKKFEEVRRGSAAELAAGVRRLPPKGEIVVVVAGAPGVKRGRAKKAQHTKGRDLGDAD